MWYIIKQISYLVFGYITILTICTIIVNQIRRDDIAKKATIEDSMKPECHPIISSMGNGVMIEYPCTGEVKEL